MYPSAISRRLWSAGITAGEAVTAHVLPTVINEANSSRVRFCDPDAIPQCGRLQNYRLVNFAQIGPFYFGCVDSLFR